VYRDVDTNATDERRNRHAFHLLLAPADGGDGGLPPFMVVIAPAFPLMVVLVLAPAMVVVNQFPVLMDKPKQFRLISGRVEACLNSTL
jgi:hypothetical protein